MESRNPQTLARKTAYLNCFIQNSYQSRMHFKRVSVSNIFLNCMFSKKYFFPYFASVKPLFFAVLNSSFLLLHYY